MWKITIVSVSSLIVLIILVSIFSNSKDLGDEVVDSGDIKIEFDSINITDSEIVFKIVMDHEGNANDNVIPRDIQVFENLRQVPFNGSVHNDIKNKLSYVILE